MIDGHSRSLTALHPTPTLQCMKIDIDALSPRELDALLKSAERRKEQLARRRPAAVVRAELIAFASSMGYGIEEIVGEQSTSGVPAAKRPGKRKAKKTGKVPVKYQDPENKRNTWSGRGSKPRWLAEKVKRGQSAADFLLPGLAKPTANRNSVGRRSVYKPG